MSAVVARQRPLVLAERYGQQMVDPVCPMLPKEAREELAGRNNVVIQEEARRQGVLYRVTWNA